MIRGGGLMSVPSQLVCRAVLQGCTWKRVPEDYEGDGCGFNGLLDGFDGRRGIPLANGCVFEPRQTSRGCRERGGCGRAPEACAAVWWMGPVSQCSRPSFRRIVQEYRRIPRIRYIVI